MPENSLNLKKNRYPCMVNIECPKLTETYTPRPTIIKMVNVKDKERNLKLEREKQFVTCEENPISRLADFSEEILQARRE